jgi:hypothetical protein
MDSQLIVQQRPMAYGLWLSPDQLFFECTVSIEKLDDVCHLQTQ